MREFSPEVYQIVEPWKSSYQPGMALPDDGISCLQAEVTLKSDGKLGEQTRMELCPGDKICNTLSGECFLFCGLINHEQGITVAHALDPGNGIAIKSEPDRTVSVQVGKCRATFEKLPLPGGGQLTADLALLELDMAVCSVGNTVWWPYRGRGRTFQIKVYDGQEISKDTAVIILDQNGHFQIGCIHRTQLTDEGMDDVMGICASENEEVSITQSGDSGALVMSIPNNEDDILYVYGIVIGISTYPNDKSMTIANSLPKVIQEISTELVDVMPNIEFACSLH